MYELAPVASRVGHLSFILRNRKTDRYIILSEPERFLWDQMNGEASLQEMATAYVLRYGTFDFDIIPILIAKLRQADLLNLQPASGLRRVLGRQGNIVARVLEAIFRGLEKATISSRKVQGTFEAVYRWGGWLLLRPTAVVLCLLLGAAGAMAAMRLLADPDPVGAPLAKHPLLAIVGVKALLLATVGLHQVVHGLALVHYKRRVREFGFTFLHGFIPTFFIDTTDIFMASRRARMITAISGTLVHLVAAAAFFLIALQLPHGLAKAFAATSGLLQVQAFVVALYPYCFIEMDGYHALVDWLGLPTLKHDAVQFVRRRMLGRLRDHKSFTREERIWIWYFALSFVSVTGLVLFTIWSIAQIFVA
jgi:putative peptide zinc metalloprotease protein